MFRLNKLARLLLAVVLLVVLPATAVQAEEGNPSGYKGGGCAGVAPFSYHYAGINTGEPGSNIVLFDVPLPAEFDGQMADTLLASTNLPNSTHIGNYIVTASASSVTLSGVEDKKDDGHGGPYMVMSTEPMQMSDHVSATLYFGDDGISSLEADFTFTCVNPPQPEPPSPPDVSHVCHLDTLGNYDGQTEFSFTSVDDGNVVQRRVNEDIWEALDATVYVSDQDQIFRNFNSDTGLASDGVPATALTAEECPLPAPTPEPTYVQQCEIDNLGNNTGFTEVTVDSEFDLYVDMGEGFFLTDERLFTTDQTFEMKNFNPETNLWSDVITVEPLSCPLPAPPPDTEVKTWCEIDDLGNNTGRTTAEVIRNETNQALEVWRSDNQDGEYTQLDEDAFTFEGDSVWLKYRDPATGLWSEHATEVVARDCPVPGKLMTGGSCNVASLWREGNPGNYNAYATFKAVDDSTGKTVTSDKLWLELETNGPRKVSVNRPAELRTYDTVTYEIYSADGTLIDSGVATDCAELPVTGMGLGTLGLIGLTLLSLGAALLGVERLRRRLLTTT